MAKTPTYIIIGHASTNNKTGGSEAAGDQAQTSSPDYSGEVLLKKMTISEFNSTYGSGNSRGTWHVVRPVNDDIADSMAALMIQGCNNPHIGYLYGGCGLTSRGGSNKINTTNNTVTDCSGMVSQAVTEACGKKFNGYSSDMGSATASFKIGNKNVFYNNFVFKSYSDRPVYNGDILYYNSGGSGHVAMVVSGVPRDGSTDTNPGTGSGGSGDVSYNGHINPIGDWMSGWGVTIFAAKGDSGQPNGYGVANPSVKCHATSILDDKGFISVAAGKEWPFNTRFEIDKLPGVVFQVDDRGNSSLFDGQKHLDIFVNDINVEEYVTTSDNQKVGLMKFAGAHQWGYNADLKVREVSSNSSGGSGYGQGSSGGGEGGGASGVIELDLEYSFVPRNEKVKETDEGYKYYKKAYKDEYGKSHNGSYAWGRFSEVLDAECKIGKGYPRLWFSKKEDGYARGVAPSLGAIMCFTNIQDAGDYGFVGVVEIVHSKYIYISYCDAKNAFHYQRLAQDDGSWNLDLDGDGIREYLFQGFIYNPRVSDVTLTKSVFQRFISKVQEYSTFSKNEIAYFVKRMTKIDPKKDAWSAAFIHAVAQDTGNMIDVIYPDALACSDIGLLGVRVSGMTNEGMGYWFDGPINGNYVLPQIGDIMIYRYKKGSSRGRYAGDKAGVVIDVTTYDRNQQSKIDKSAKNRRYKCKVAIGDGSTVQIKEAISNTNELVGLYRPNWSAVDGTSEISQYIVSPIGMYNEGTTIEDAAIRDIAYAEYGYAEKSQTKKQTENKKDKAKKVYKPSIKKTGITLSAINYTGMLSNMYSVLVGLKASNDDDESVVPDIWSSTELSQFDIDIFATEPYPTASPEQALFQVPLSREGYSAQTDIGKMTIDGTCRVIFNELYAELKNKGAVVGIMACMWGISQFKVDYLDKTSGAIGLIGWKDLATGGAQGGRKTQLKRYCLDKGEKKPWNKSLSGQLNFLISETMTGADFKKCWKGLMKVEDSLEGAEDASVAFYKQFVLEGDTSKIDDAAIVANLLLAATSDQQKAEIVKDYFSSGGKSFSAYMGTLYSYCQTIWSLFIGL